MCFLQYFIDLVLKQCLQFISTNICQYLIFSLHVTPYSKLVFRVYDHSTFKKDALLGDCR